MSDDSTDDVYFRVNHDLSDLLHQFDQGDDDDYDSLVMNDSVRGMPLGFKPGSWQSEIPEIQKRQLPREDGYQDTFYEKKNAGDRPFGKDYMSEQRDRELIMEKNPDYRFIVLLSGALGKSPIDLYQEQDIERLLREREADRIRLQQELRRTIVPIEEKKKQRTELINQKERIQSDQRLFVPGYYNNLIQIGTYLINGSSMVGNDNKDRFGINVVELMLFDFLILMSKIPIKSQSSLTEMRKRVNFVNAEHWSSDTTREKEKELGEKTFNNDDEKQLHAFIPITLFKYFLDNQVYTEARRIIHINQYYSTTLSKVFTQDNYEKVKEGDEQSLEMLPTLISIPEEEEEEVTNKSKIYWYRFRGTETVNLTLVEECYDEASIKKMSEIGLQKNYGGVTLLKGKYAEIIKRIVTLPLTDQKVNDDLRMNINILKDHPEAIMTLIRLLPEKPSTNLVKELLQSHFIWHYFNDKTSLGLAIEWFNNEKKNTLSSWNLLSSTREKTQKLIKNLKKHLFLYFSVIILICNTDKVPIVLGEKSIFRFPSNIVDRVNEKEVLEEEKGFDLLNESFRDIGPHSFIINTQFKNYYVTGETPFSKEKKKKKKIEPISQPVEKNDTYIDTMYPIFRLHYIFQVYNQFVGMYSDFLTNQLNEVNESIQIVENIIRQISNEDNHHVLRRNPHPFYDQRQSFVQQPINSGIVKLKAVVVLYMNKAYNKIQQYCDELRGLPQEEFQSDQALACGLESEFACFIAALIAEKDIIHPTGYKSLASQRAIIMHCANTLTQFRKYRYRKKSNGTYEIFIEYINKFPRPHNNTGPRVFI